MAEKTSRIKVLSSETKYTGRVFTVRRDELIEPTGMKAVREIITHPGSVVVFPVFDDGRILIIRQYRYATRQFMWELVAGHREPGEDFRVGAARELKEETGYTARRYRKLLEIYPSPGFLGERMVIFLAEGLTKGKARPEDDERIEARRVSSRSTKPNDGFAAARFAMRKPSPACSTMPPLFEGNGSGSASNPKQSL